MAAMMLRPHLATAAPIEPGEIPLLDLNPTDLAALPQARRLIQAMMDTHPALPMAARLGEGVSRRWLARQASPYRAEIERVAGAMGQPGGWFFNIVYEWACSTSVAADPSGDGTRMIRVLDWGLSGLGRHLVIARQSGPAGDFYNVTWPGYAGVLTAMAPGRFSAAINQAPRPPGPPWRWLSARDSIPAAHLLRLAFEQAPDYEAAIQNTRSSHIAWSMRRPPAWRMLARSSSRNGRKPKRRSAIGLSGAMPQFCPVSE
jgi:hypothetical protein